MYTPSQIAQMLDIAGSTLRRYAALFGEYLSSGARQRRRIYSEGDLETLIRVRELLADGTLIKDIPPKLELELDKVIDQEQESTALALPGLIIQLKDMQEIFDRQASQIDQLQKRLDWIEQPFYKKIGRTPPE